MAPAFTHSLFGVECTYFIHNTSPSLFFTAACGFSFWMDPSIGDLGLGPGFVGGAGYEFSRNQRAGCEIMYSIGKGDAANIPSQCISIMVVYTLRFL